MPSGEATVYDQREREISSETLAKSIFRFLLFLHLKCDQMERIYVVAKW